MTSILKNKLRLKPSILTLFVILTVPVFVTIVSATYLSNDKQARANARELIERFRVDAIENIQSVFDPIKSLVRTSRSEPGIWNIAMYQLRRICAAVCSARRNVSG